MKPQPSGCTAFLKVKYLKSYIDSLTEATTVAHLHADGKGMIKNRSVCDASYFVVIADEYSRFVRAISIGNKSEVSDLILAFVRWSERQYGQLIRLFHSDGGKGFLQVCKALKANGVDFRESTPYTPQSNRLTERHVRTVLTAFCAALRQDNLPMWYLDHVV